MKSNIAKGYTFIARKFLGKKIQYSNQKSNDYAFTHVDSILFHVGSENIRSQKAVLKLGASKITELMFPHNGIDILHFE